MQECADVETECKRTKIESIGEALLIEGFLSRENAEAAVALLIQYLCEKNTGKWKMIPAFKSR